MDAVTQHGAQPCPIESLPQKIFAHSRLAARHMGARHQVAPQQRAQCVRIEPVRLDLRIGNEPRLVGMGQHHLLYPFELFKLIVNEAPIPARFHYRLVWPSQARKKLSETKRRVALHAGFPQLPASLIHCAKHTILLVNVYSNVIHENSSFLFFSTLCTERLLSFYPTPMPDARREGRGLVRNFVGYSNVQSLRRDPIQVLYSGSIFYFNVYVRACARVSIGGRSYPARFSIPHEIFLDPNFNRYPHVGAGTEGCRAVPLNNII